MITSVKNPLVRYVQRLMRKNSFRREEKKFVVEGRRETWRAIRGGYILEKLIVCPSIDPNEKWVSAFREHFPGGEIVEVSAAVYAAMAYRGGTEGVMAIGLQKDHRPRWEELPEQPLLLVAERIQKPGNIGAILRTTDAVGTDAAIFIHPLTDLYNPNVIRSSLGTLFTQRVWLAGPEDLAEGRTKKHFRIWAATLQNSRIYWQENYREGTALAVGNEAEGLSDAMRTLADGFIYIPMNGIADSLNVSVSAAVLLYEALRQREQDER